MPIRFRCSCCQQPMAIAHRKAGTSVTCAQCNAALTVPAVSDSALDSLRRRRRDNDSDPPVPWFVDSNPPVPWFVTAPGPNLAPPAPEEGTPLPAPSAPFPASSPEGSAALPTDIDLKEPSGPDAPDRRSPRRRALALAALLLLLLLIPGLLLTIGSSRREDGLTMAAGKSAAPSESRAFLMDRMPGPDGKAAAGVQTLADPLLLKDRLPVKGPLPGKGPSLRPLLGEEGPPVVIPPKPRPGKQPPVRPRVESEDELYRAALKTAGDALAGQHFEQAITWYKIAGKIRTGDEVVQGLFLAEQGRLEAHARAEARSKQREQEKRLALYGQWMLSGQSARSLGEFDRAITAFTEALKLFPEDVHAGELLVQTKQKRDRPTELARLADDRNQDATAQEKGAQYRSALQAGWESMRLGKFAAAKSSFAYALTLRPEDSEANTGLGNALEHYKVKKWQEERREEEQWQRHREELAREEEKQKAKEYQTFLALGRQAQEQRRPGEALGLFIQALEARPDDPTALSLRDEALEARDRLFAQREREEKKRAEAQALAAAVAAQKLERLRLEQAVLKKEEDGRRKAAEFRQFLIDGQLALAGGKFADALALLDRAGALQPDDPAVRALQQEASKRKGEPDTARQQLKEIIAAQALAREESARRKLEKRQLLLAEQAAKEQEQRRAATYKRFLENGKRAFDQHAFADAADQFTAALRVRPGDAPTAGLLEKARQQSEAHLKAIAAKKEERERQLATAAKEAQQKKEALDRARAEQQAQAQAARKVREFEQFLIDGRLALSKGKTDTALGLFAKARKLQPDDPGLAGLLEQAHQRQEKVRTAQAEKAKLQAREDARREEQRQLARAKKEQQDKDRRAEQSARQRSEDYKNALKHGLAALAQGKPRSALVAFREALLLRPGDDEAGAGLRQAEQDDARLLADAQQKATEQEQERQRLLAQQKARRLAGEYDQFMKYGQEALLKGRLDAAAGAFTEALQRVPADAEAEAGLTRARGLLARANEAAAQAAQERRR